MRKPRKKKPDWDKICKAIKEWNETGAPGTLKEFDRRHEHFKKTNALAKLLGIK